MKLFELITKSQHRCPDILVSINFHYFIPWTLFRIKVRILRSKNQSVKGPMRGRSVSLPHSFSLFLSEIGLALRVSGQNYILGESYGISKDFTITTVVAISNAIVAMSGAVLGQLQGFVDINMGNGLIIIGLVSVIIGEKVYNSTKIYIMFIMSAIGAVLYKIAVTLALFSSDVGLGSSDIYIITAVMMIAMMFKKTTA